MMTKHRASSEPKTFAQTFKAGTRLIKTLQRFTSGMGVLAGFLAISLWLNEPKRIEFASWLIPGPAYEIFTNTFNTDAVPSVAYHASKIPANLVDQQAIDSQVLKTESEREAVAKYLSNKYKIAMSASREFVAKAATVSQEVGLDPTLILAVAAVESSFNPLAESKKGAQGLMQVMTRVHLDKYQLFGGHEAALDPDANLRVGAWILREYIAKGGSLEAGLRLYVGASSSWINDGGYGDKVLAERQRLRQAAGQKYAERVKLIPPIQL